MEKNYLFIKKTPKMLLKPFRLSALLVALFTITSYGIGYSQSGCTSCTYANPIAKDNLPLAINNEETICITGTQTYQNLSVNGNGTLCIAKDATLIITGNFESLSKGATLNIELYGKLQLSNPEINPSININIYETGFLNTSNINFKGTGTNTIINYGTIVTEAINFSGTFDDTYVFKNYKSITVNGTINSGSNTVKIQNQADLKVTGNFGLNIYSLYINCGSIDVPSGLNINGGKIINSGSFTEPDGQINMSSGSVFENYGTFLGKLHGAGSTSIFYNEGLAKLMECKEVSLKGPSDSNKKGYVYIINQISANGIPVGPNLDFTRYSSFNPDVYSGVDVFYNGIPTWKKSDNEVVSTPEEAGVTFNSGGSPSLYSGACPDENGLFPPVPNTRYWVGSENSTDPADPNNWSNKTIPNPGDHVEFATIKNNDGTPAINDLKTTDDMIIGNLTNASDKNLIISEETSVVIDGKVTITDPVTNQPSTDPSKIQVKASDGKANGSLIINCDENSTTVNGKKELKPIFATVELYGKGKKVSEFKWLDTIPGSPTKDKVTYTGNYQWQHFGVPVKSVKANPTFSGAFLREYSEPLNAANSYYFKWIILNNESNLTKFKGYEITQDAPTKYFIKGELVFCEQEITLTHTATLVKGSTDDEIYNKRYGLGQNIFGNSFTSSIPIKDIVFKNGVENVVYMYNTGTFGEWAVINRANIDDKSQTAGNYIAVPKETASEMDYGNIPSMQGFLLRHLAPGGNENSITMSLPYMSLTKNTKPQLAPRFNDGKTNDELGFVRIQLTSKSTVDNLWFFSQSGTSENYNNGWDGRKYFGTPTAFIFSETPDGPMQVNTSETIDGNVISFYPNDDKEYTFAIVRSNLDNYRDLHLVDIATKNIISLHNDTTMYHFTSNVANKINKRFVIVNKAKEQINFDNDEFDLLDAYLSSSTNELTVSNFTGKNGIMRIYDVAGSLIMNDEMITGTNQYQPNLNPGTYILNLSASGKEKSIKILIKKP